MIKEYKRREENKKEHLRQQKEKEEQKRERKAARAAAREEHRIGNLLDKVMSLTMFCSSSKNFSFFPYKIFILNKLYFCPET